MSQDKEVFTVTTTGQGQPDYAQPQTGTIALTAKFPEMELAGKRYDDFAKIAFVADTRTEYIIGTNANAAKSGSWVAGTVTKEIAFFSNEPCYIRFNDRNAIAHEVPAGLMIRFYRRVDRIYVSAVLNPGTLYAYIEG